MMFCRPASLGMEVPVSAMSESEPPLCGSCLSDILLNMAVKILVKGSEILVQDVM